MSHFTTVKTHMKDLMLIKQSVEDLGMTFIESENLLEVRGYQGQKHKSNLVIRASDHYDIGVIQTEEGYEFVADWWGIEIETGVKEKEMVERITQRYAYHKVVKEVEKHNFTLEEEVKDDEIHLIVRRWE